MGKSLSIMVISIQVYNINGWSIYPPHLALGDDVELPLSMEHLRPYLRKRKGSFVAPPGLRHNQRYYPKALQSRQLLMHSTTNSDSHDSTLIDNTEFPSKQEAKLLMDKSTLQLVKKDWEKYLFQKEMKAMKNMEFSEYRDYLQKKENTMQFINKFELYLNESKPEYMTELKQQFQSFKFDSQFTQFLNWLICYLRTHENDTTTVRDILKDIISIQHPNNPNQSDQDKLMITMESLTKDIIGAEADNIWLYSYLWLNLYHDPESGIIAFSRQTLDDLSVKPKPCKELKYYTNFLAQMVNSNKYPYLKTVNGRYYHISVLQEIFKVCHLGSKQTQELVTTMQVMWNMYNQQPKDERNRKRIRIWIFELWSYAVSLELVPADAELQDSYQDIYGDMNSLNYCIEMLTLGYPDTYSDVAALDVNFSGFVVKINYLQQVFAKFENEVSSNSSEIYHNLYFVKRQYKEVQFDPYVIEKINAMNLILKSKYDEDQKNGILHVLRMIISPNGMTHHVSNENGHIMVTLQSLTRDIVDGKDDDHIWRYKYLYSLIYQRAVAKQLIPDNEQRQDPKVVASNQYNFAKAYDIIIFTGKSLKYEDKSDDEKEIELNSMSGDKQKYPILEIITKEKQAVQIEELIRNGLV